MIDRRAATSSDGAVLLVGGEAAERVLVRCAGHGDGEIKNWNWDDNISLYMYIATTNSLSF